jgi:S1-C subfamily serine protease
MALLVACSGSIKTPDRTRMTTKEIVEASKPAIVRVESNFGGEEAGGVGTGFVLTADGRIATNLHVIQGASEVQVTLLDGSKHEVTRVHAIDSERDLAIISIRPTAQLSTLALGNSDIVSAGDHVIAIGNPLGVLDYTVSDGLISSVRPLTQSLTILQISAPISQGSSGGPLFNHYGEVIGVATAIFTEGQNLNFGVPSNYLRSLLANADEAGITMDEFAKRFQEAQENAASQAGTPDRDVPDHEVGMLEGCSDAALVEVFDSIRQAIAIGAPLYNEGNREACYRVYEGTAMRLEREISCPGLRDALGHGLLRANATDTDDFTAKAWAMRDTFDGIIDVIVRKAREP